MTMMTGNENDDWAPVSPRSLNIHAYLAEETVVFKPAVIQHLLHRCADAHAVEQALALPPVRSGLRHLRHLELPQCPIHPSDFEMIDINTSQLHALSMHDNAARMQALHAMGAFAHIRQLTLVAPAGLSNEAVAWVLAHEHLQYLELQCDVTRAQLLRLMAPGRALNVKLQRFHKLLWNAVVERDAPLLHALAAAGADIDSCDPNKMTLLTTAIAQDKLEAVPALLAAGAGLHVSDGYGFTPVAWAALRGNEAALRLLVGAGADIHRLDPHGRSPLELAIRGNALGAVRCLVALGSDVRQVNVRGSTPLIEATLHGDLDMVRWIVGAGADPHALCKRGMSAFNHATLAGKHAVAAFLKDCAPSRPSARSPSPVSPVSPIAATPASPVASRA